MSCLLRLSSSLNLVELDLERGGGQQLTNRSTHPQRTTRARSTGTGPRLTAARGADRTVPGWRPRRPRRTHGRTQASWPQRTKAPRTGLAIATPVCTNSAVISTAYRVQLLRTHIRYSGKGRCDHVPPQPTHTTHRCSLEALSPLFLSLSLSKPYQYASKRVCSRMPARPPEDPLLRAGPHSVASCSSTDVASVRTIEPTTEERCATRRTPPHRPRPGAHRPDHLRQTHHTGLGRDGSTSVRSLTVDALTTGRLPPTQHIATVAHPICTAVLVMRSSRSISRPSCSPSAATPSSERRPHSPSSLQQLSRGYTYVPNRATTPMFRRLEEEALPSRCARAPCSTPTAAQCCRCRRHPR